jgi:hypothetical protein
VPSEPGSWGAARRTAKTTSLEVDISADRMSAVKTARATDAFEGDPAWQVARQHSQRAAAEKPARASVAGAGDLGVGSCIAWAVGPRLEGRGLEAAALRGEE